MNLIKIAEQEKARINKESEEKMARFRARIADEKRRAEYAMQVFKDVLSSLDEVKSFGIGKSRLSTVDYALIVLDFRGRTFEIHYNDSILKATPNWGGNLYNVYHDATYSLPGSPEDVVKWFVNWLTKS